MLDRPDDVALLSMREQARRAGVPAATMTRLAKRLGLDGYDDVRALYAGAVRARGALGFAGKAGVQVEAQSLHGERALAADMALSLSRQIARLAEPGGAGSVWPTPPAACTRARRVYCLGLRSCHAAAWHFHYTLSLLGDKTVMLDDAGGTGLDAIRDAGPDDVVLVASVEPYARATIEAARYAADRRACRWWRSPTARSRRSPRSAANDHPGGDRKPVLLPYDDAAAGAWPRSSRLWWRGRSGRTALDALERYRGTALGVRCPPAASYSQEPTRERS